MSQQRWIITGASGQLGGHLLARLAEELPDAAILAHAGQQPVLDGDFAVARVALERTDALRELVISYRPTHVIHTAAMTAVGACHADPERARLCNVAATEALAEAAERVGARFVFTSTDMVFAGTAAPYAEGAEPDSPSVYGRTKIAAERALAAQPRTLVVRVPLLYGQPRTARRTTFADQIAALRDRRPVRLFTDEYRTPVALCDAARALVGLARSEACGLIHLAGPQRLSRFELIEQCAAMLGIERPVFEPISRLSIDSPEPRPADLSLTDERLQREFPELMPGPIRGEAIGA